MESRLATASSRTGYFRDDVSRIANVPSHLLTALPWSDSEDAVRESPR